MFLRVFKCFLIILLYVNNISAKETDLEESLHHMSNKFDDILRKSDQLYEDPKLEIYLQSIMDKLFPEYVGEINVFVLKAPLLNAFALPNGSIYMNTGILSTFENEAQLATVLAHEGIHYINHHGKKNYETGETVGAISTFATIVIASLGIGYWESVGSDLIKQLFALGVFSGYSRSLESEADTEGFMRLKKAGYDVTQSPKVFEYLRDDVKANDIDQPFLFSTHPKLQNRIDNFNQLIEKSGIAGGVLGNKYNTEIRKLRLYAIDQKLKNGMYKSVIYELSRPNRGQLYGDHYKYYIGEAHRLGTGDGKEIKAEISYKEALSDAPDFPETYRSLGLIYYKKKQCGLANISFRNYLKLSPGANDKGYIEHYLKTCIQ